MINTRLRALFNEADWADEQMQRRQLSCSFCASWPKQIDQDWPAVLEKLERLRQYLVNRRRLLCQCHPGRRKLGQVQPQLAGFLASLPAVSA